MLKPIELLHRELIRKEASRAATILLPVWLVQGEKLVPGNEITAHTCTPINRMQCRQCSVEVSCHKTYILSMRSIPLPLPRPWSLLCLLKCFGPSFLCVSTFPEAGKHTVVMLWRTLESKRGDQQQQPQDINHQEWEIPPAASPEI